MSKRDDAVRPEDLALFREAVKDVRRHSLEVRFVAKREKPVKIRKSLSFQSDTQIPQYRDPIEQCSVRPTDILQFNRASIQKGVLKKLRRGALTISDEIDLHHYTVDQARSLLAEFLRVCRAGPQTCVRIVHGKGFGSPHQRPRLKGMVNFWLKQDARVLAFYSALEKDGGTGAVYVYLKSQ